MADEVVTPLVVKQVYVVQGGSLKKEHWAVETRDVDGLPFFVASPKDRTFAKTLGVNANYHPHPFNGNTILRELAALRDKAVDSIIQQRMAEDDPHAERMPTRLSKADRLNALHKGIAPEVICSVQP